MSEQVLLLNLLFEGIVAGLVYALTALGFSLIWRVCGVIHIAHGGVLLLAGTAIHLASHAGAPLALALTAGCLAAVVSGLLIEEMFYRPLRRLGAGEFGLITVSLGVLIVIEYSIVIAFGPDDLMLTSQSLRQPLIPAIPFSLDLYAVLSLISVLGSFALCALVIDKTAMGRAMRALASNAELATVVGLNTESARRWAMVLGSLMVVPAVTLMLFNTGVSPTDGLHIVLVAATVAIIGGRGSLAGALIGGILIGVAESLMVFFLPYSWRPVITFVPLYFLLLLRPQGILGGRA